MSEPVTATGAVAAPASEPALTDVQLLRQIESAIRADRVVRVADLTIRYCKRGQEFADQDQHFQALTSGVFLRLNVFEGGTADFTQPTRTTWGYYTSLDDLDIALKTPLAKLSSHERIALSADLAFSATLASFRADAAQRRRQAPSVEQVSFDQPPTL